MKKFKFNDQIIYKEHEKMILAFNVENSDTYEFDETGSEIFKLITQNLAIEEIVRILCEKYSSDDTDEIKNDIIEFIEKLKKLGVVKDIDE